MFSGAFCAGLIEARAFPISGLVLTSFPALFAPASLKRARAAARRDAGSEFSGAFCAGLIEASHSAFAAFTAAFVFRRFLRRPH